MPLRPPSPAARSLRRAALALPALAALLALGACDRRPPVHVVLIVIDTLRPDHLSLHGYERPTSPVLDELAERAHVFENAYSVSSWTSPGTASILTGLHSIRHGTRSVGIRLHEDARPLALRLSEAGLATCGLSFNPHVSRANGFDLGFDAFADHAGVDVTHYPDVSEMIPPALAWIESTRRRDSFLYLHPMNTHGPYKVPEAHRGDLLGREPDPTFEYFGELMDDILRQGRLERREDVTPRYLRSLVEQYDTAIRYTTDQLGRVIDGLKEQGLFDSALVVVTSDHGEELFDHGGFSHGYSLHEEAVRVPLIVKLPGQREGRRIDERVSVMDIVPTVLRALGRPVPEDLDGRPLQGLMAGDPAAERSFAARALHFEVEKLLRCYARASLEGDWKTIYVHVNYEGLERSVSLHDLASDPTERRDLVDERPELVDQGLERMRAAFLALGRGALKPGRGDGVDEERLRSLGYLQ